MRTLILVHAEEVLKEVGYDIALAVAILLPVDEAGACAVGYSFIIGQTLFSSNMLRGGVES